MFKKLYQYICKQLGYAYDVCSFYYEGIEITLRSDGWVTIDDGTSKDMVPIYYCTKKLIKRIVEEENK